MADFIDQEHEHRSREVIDALRKFVVWIKAEDWDPAFCVEFGGCEIVRDDSGSPMHTDDFTDIGVRFRLIDLEDTFDDD